MRAAVRAAVKGTGISRVRPCRCGAVQDARGGWRALLCATQKNAMRRVQAWPVCLERRALRAAAVSSDACSGGGDRLSSGGAIGRGVEGLSADTLPTADGTVEIASRRAGTDGE